MADFDVFKVLKDLELMAVGVDPNTQKMQEGYFASFRTMGLPIRPEDFANPFTPIGINLEDPQQIPAPVDPKTEANATGASNLDQSTLPATLADKAAAATAAERQSYLAFLNGYLIVDEKLQMSNDYSVYNQASTVGDTWFYIITGANAVAPKDNSDPNLQQQITQYRAVLIGPDGLPTDQYKAYQTYQGNFQKAQNALWAEWALANLDPDLMANFGTEGQPYQDAVDQAEQDWEALGYKQQVEEALDFLSAQGMDPSIAVISQAKQWWKNSQIQIGTLGQFPWIQFLPGDWYDPSNDDGWTEYSMSNYNTQANCQQSSTAFGGKAGIQVGFWTANAGLSDSNTNQAMQLQAQDLEVTFKYMMVDVFRPWMKSMLFGLPNWYLVGGYKQHCISDGTFGQQLPATTEATFLPSVVTQLILIKDLSITWTNWQQDWSTATQGISATAGVGYGPWAIQGQYSHNGTTSSFDADTTHDSLMSPGIQLVGYISAITPASPQLDTPS